MNGFMFPSWFFVLDWLYIKGTIDPKCLGKELWKLGEFRDEKHKRKVRSRWAKRAGRRACQSATNTSINLRAGAPCLLELQGHQFSPFVPHLYVLVPKRYVNELNRAELSNSHTRTFNVLMLVGLHLIMMQTQVTMISIQHAVDPVEHSKVSGELSCIPEDFDVVGTLRDWRREKGRKNGRKRQEFVKINQACEWNLSGVIPIKLDWLYIEGKIDPKCLGKELWKLGEFRDEKRKRKIERR
ncbi:hypothetical protein H5410_021297 [Solanum commersonii]|uniref:Late blight resistance protein n=1 Tax=Solanum commersonii TaxID=4109 RepID=A0A9J5ZDV2_SOLCO|nr:hypothetical protein H5410_021297 [Solanum commersonii]